MTRLLEKYNSEIIPALKEELGKTNVHAVPKLEKIVVSMGVGEAVQDRKRLDAAVDHLTTLSGQKAQVCRAKKSVSGFRLQKACRSAAVSLCVANACMNS